MAWYKYYNIQLLPLDTSKTGLVRSKGYMELATLLRKTVATAKKRKNLELVSAPLRNDMYFVPFFVTIKKKAAVGTFLKYNHIDAIRDLYTGDELQKVGAGRTNKRYEFQFVYRYDLHILAIEDREGLPSSNPLIGVLNELFQREVESNFPDHLLTITELTNSESLEAVFQAEGYRRVEVDVTFSNSDDFDDGLNRELEKELRGKNIHKLEHIEKSGKNGFMSDMTDYSKVLLRLATKYGNGAVRYIKDNVIKTYHMKDFPVRIKVVQEKDESDSDYLRKVYRSIKSAKNGTRTKQQDQDD